MPFIKYSSSQIIILLSAIFVLQACSFSEDITHIKLREARCFALAGNLKKAEETFQSIPVLNQTKSSPIKLMVLMNMSRFYLNSKDYTKTISMCDKALSVCNEVYGEKDPLKLSILFMLASAWEGLKDYDKAATIYNSFLPIKQSAPQNEPGKEIRNILTLIKLGDISYKQYDLRQALRFYRQAYSMTLLPNSLYRIINYRIAFCSVALGRYYEAESYFKNSLPVGYRDAGPVELYKVYAKLLRKNAKYGGAENVLISEINWQARHKEYLDWLYSRIAKTIPFNSLNEFTEKDFADFAKTSKNTLEEAFSTDKERH